jgi:hypothetical protein
MKVGAAIYSMLKDDSAVSALVGTRIYPELAEEGAATPYVVYSVVSNTPVDTKDSAPVDEAQLEVFSVADTYAAANDLADKVRAALSRQSKKVYGTVTVQSVKYTNEVTEVSAARDMYISVQDYTARLTPVIPNLLLEQYPGAYAAYSLRRVRGEYTGPSIRVRKITSAPYPEQDIGFDADGNLDLNALTSFLDGNAGNIERLYDQSGNGRDVVNTNAAFGPGIATSEGVYTVDEKAALRFDGVNDQLDIDSSGLDIGSLSSFMVMKLSVTSGLQFPLALSVTPLRWYAPFVNSGNFNYAYAGQSNAAVTSANTDNNLHTQIAGTTQGNMTAFLNGTSVDTATLSSGIETGFTDGIGAVNGANFLDGFIQEIIIYDSDQSANRTGIESNINTHYSIY